MGDSRLPEFLMGLFISYRRLLRLFLLVYKIVFLDVNVYCFLFSDVSCDNCLTSLINGGGTITWCQTRR